MKKVGQFLKRNKHTVIVGIICVFLVILVYVVKFTFLPNEGTAIYGDRLDGIKAVEIKKDEQNEIKTNLEEKEEVKEASVSTAGRILNVIITVNDDVSLDTAKSLTDSIDSVLEEDQKRFYDTQVFIKKTGEDASFPIIGYRHQDNDTYSWTKDR